MRPAAAVAICLLVPAGVAVSQPATSSAPATAPATRPAAALYLTDADITFLREQIAANRDPWADEFRRLAERLEPLRRKGLLFASVRTPDLPTARLPLFRSVGVLRPRDLRGAEAPLGQLAELLTDGRLARDLALHYRLAGPAAEADAAAAVKILRTWPQAVADRVVDQRIARDIAGGLPAMLYAAELLRVYRGCDAARREPFEKWAVALAEGVRMQEKIHAGYLSKPRGLYQATWARHLALAAGTLFGRSELADWAVRGDPQRRSPIGPMLAWAFDDAKDAEGLAEGRPLRTRRLDETAFALQPLLLMGMILRNRAAADPLSPLGLDAKGRAWAGLRRIGRFLCNDIHWPGAGAQMPRDSRGRAELPIVFGEATLFVPLTAAAGGEPSDRMRALAHRVLRHNPRARPRQGGGLDDRARIEPWVLGPVFLTHYRRPLPASRPAATQPATGPR